MEPFGSKFYLSFCNIYLFLLGASTALNLKVPSELIHGVKGRPLVIPVQYSFNTAVCEIQITWLLNKPDSKSTLLVTAKNRSIIPDLEYQHKVSLSPLNASLLIKELHSSDEGEYTVKVTIQGKHTESQSHKIQVTVDVPVTKPRVRMEPHLGAVEYVGNLTLRCSVQNGTRVSYHWLKRGVNIEASSRYSFSPNKQMFFISPVTKEDIANYSCIVKNFVSQQESELITPNIYYGPYDLTVNSDKGQKGELFTVDIGEVILLFCSADSNPPNNYSWFQRLNNETVVITRGPHFEIKPDNAAQKTAEYVCCAYNNITGRKDETQFTLVVTPRGQEKLSQKGTSLPSLAVITAVSLFVIVSITIKFLWKRCRPHKVIKQKLYSGTQSDYVRTQTFSGHEDAMNDFGIYEFVALPGSSEPSKVTSNKTVSSTSSAQCHDTHTTIYEVISHVPDPV